MDLDNAPNPITGEIPFGEEHLITSKTLTKFLPAFLKAQKEMSVVHKDKPSRFKDGDGKTAYFASLDSIMSTVKKPLNDNDIVINFFQKKIEGEERLWCRLSHISNEWVQSSMALLLKIMQMPDMGAAITYGQRYLLPGLCGVASSDEEGVEADAPQGNGQKNFQADNESKVSNLEVAKSNPNPAASSQIGEKIINVGRLTGKTFDQAGARAISESLDYWIRKEKENGKPLSGKPAEFVRDAKEYLAMAGSRDDLLF